MGFSEMGRMMAGLSFHFQHDGEIYLPNQRATVFLSSTSCGETSLPKRRTVSTICTIDIHLPTISAHDIHFRGCRQPLTNTLSLPISKQTNNLVRLQVHEDTAEALAAPPTPIVHPNNMHLANRHRRGTR